jgi:hypothetical protein
MEVLAQHYLNYREQRDDAFVDRNDKIWNESNNAMERILSRVPNEKMVEFKSIVSRLSSQDQNEE